MIDISEHLGLAQKIAWGFYPKIHKKYEFEDILQVAYVGLVKAGKSFDETRGIKFSTYAVPKIKGELIRFLKDDKKYNISRGVPHDYTMLSFEFENENGCLRDKIGNNDFECGLIKIISVNESINNLSNQEKKILKLYFIDNLTQKQIGEICGILQNQVSRIKRRVVKKLRESLEINGCEKVAM
jgi:RNA polymerase sporulation-specific sigma factor